MGCEARRPAGDRGPALAKDGRASNKNHVIFLRKSASAGGIAARCVGLCRLTEPLP